ncbi:MAG: hypothetical protein DRP45_10615 [Candidatus Zixiibacteriota bacterium]|nr:MAG: hypothetical protein DRP45_10615 [candidate division Zixibacteria bacterium]
MYSIWGHSFPGKWDYVTLVDDVNAYAEARLNELGIGGFPTTFFDAGYRELVGGYTAESEYTSRMDQCGARGVVTGDLQMLMAVDWLGGKADEELSITIGIGNGISPQSGPGQPTILSGETLGKPDWYYIFETVTSDPEANDLEYQWIWAEGDTSEWVGPVPSGEMHSKSHRWDDQGTYDIKVRAKDTWGEITEYSMPWSITIDCCHGTVGNIDLDSGDLTDGADLSVLIDRLFINITTELPCLKQADINLSGAPEPDYVDIDGADLSELINKLFIDPEAQLPVCPY